MYDDLSDSINEKGRCYLFLDELQEIDGWEKAVNSLLENQDVDIYVTGSNSKLMSSEISTYLSGRYVSIPVYTLSFKEYINFKRYDDKDAKAVFDEYLQYGGFPNTLYAKMLWRAVMSMVLSSSISRTFY